MDITPLLKQVARGQHGSEHLTQQQAQHIFAYLLQPDADLLQLGAFLIAERMKGESSPELAGFVQAARQHIAHFCDVVAPTNAVDLPCYAGKRRAGHAYLIAALAARDAGIPIVVHGVQAIEGRITAWQVLKGAGVQSAPNLLDAGVILKRDGMVYLDLEDICPNLHRIYHLRDRLGVRSFANTVARLLNPMGCDRQINGFFHTPYADYMAQANVLLGQKQSLIFMGAEGEPELYADRQKVVKEQIAEQVRDLSFADSGCPLYPRQAVENLQNIHDDFQRMLHGEHTDRQQATIDRMLKVLLGS